MAPEVHRIDGCFVESAPKTRATQVRTAHDRGDVLRIFDEVRRHWGHHPTLSALPLVLSNYGEDAPQRPFSFVLVNSQPERIMLVFTTWHDHDELLRFWDAEVMPALFATQQFILDKDQMVVRHVWGEVLEAGPRFADDTGVMPYILRSDFAITALRHAE